MLFFLSLLAIDMVSLDVEPEKRIRCCLQKLPFVLACYFVGASNLFMFFFFFLPSFPRAP